MVKCLLTILLFAGGTTAHALTLAKAGQAQAVIVTATDATAAERTAGAELAKYLQQITGAAFRTVPQAEARGTRILVGPSATARQLLGAKLVDGLGPEEFIVRTVGRDLLLVGGRPRGTLYAVYSFLGDDLGCRWLTWYGEESIPHQRRLLVPVLSRREKPAMAVRDIVCHTNGDSDRQLMQRFLVRNRCQGPDLHFTGDLSAVGGAAHRYAYPPDGWFVHTLFQWLPPQTHFAAHPEWYSLAGDKRVDNRQLCFTNPNLRAALTRAILKRIGEADASGLYSVSAMDWPGAFCDCPECRALVEREGTPGAPLFDYLAELGPQLKQAYPQARISTLAYRKEQSEAPPRTIKLPDNIVIVFAPIDDNFAAPLEHPSNDQTRRNLEHWPQAASCLWVWYYPNTYGPALPMGNLGRLAADFRFFRRVGVQGFFIEQDAAGVYDSQRATDLQTWLITRLMWNPDADLKGLIADYTAHHYGPAAPLAREYLEALEQATARQTTPMGWNAAAGQHHYLTPGLLLQSQGLLDRAEATVAGDPVYLPRVQYLRLSVDLACLLLWNRLTAAGELPFTRAALAARYRETYTRATQTRLLPARQPTVLQALAASLRWQEVMTALKPLPPPLDQVPATRVRQFTPETSALHGKAPALVEDPRAAAGIAVTMTPSFEIPAYAPKGLPANVLNMGYYDEVTRRQHHAYAGKDAPAAAGEYRLYPIGRTALSPKGCVWFDWSWSIQLRDITSLYDPAAPDKQWDIYASIRFEGPAYEAASPAEHNRFYVDRLVFVAAD